MAETSAIEWTDATWNPITGCTLVSEGCRHCYAATLAATRLKNHPSREGLARINAAGEAKFTGEVRFNEGWLADPLKWKRPRRIFVCAHGDLFHESVPDGWIMRILDVMGRAQHHTFQVLTKRPERMRDFFRRWADVNWKQDLDFKGARGPAEVRAAHTSGRGQLFADMLDAMGTPPKGCAYPLFDWAGGMSRWPDVLPNVWLGTSAEDAATYRERWAHVAATPAAVRMLSAEPLLGPLGDLDLGRVGAPNWVIVGGESGRGARPMHPDWARSLRDQCAAAGVPFFFKQWGEWAPSTPEAAGFNPRSGWRCLTGHPHVPKREELYPEAGAAFVENMGKKRAGRLLDGVTHDGTPT